MSRRGRIFNQGVLRDMSRFEQLPPKVPNLGFSSEGHWFVTRLINQTDTSEFIVSNQYAPLDYLDVYLVRDGAVVKEVRGGELRPLSANSHKHRTFNQQFTLESGQEYQLLFFVRSESSVQLPAVLFEKNAYLEHVESETATFYFITLMFVMVFYNLLLLSRPATECMPRIWFTCARILDSGFDEWLCEALVV